MNGYQDVFMWLLKESGRLLGGLCGSDGECVFISADDETLDVSVVFDSHLIKLHSSSTPASVQHTLTLTTPSQYTLIQSLILFAN